MNKELQEYYEARFEMFASKGWKDLMEDILKIDESVSNIDNCNSPDMLHFRKGEKSIISWLKNLKSMSEEAYENLKNESNV